MVAREMPDPYSEAERIFEEAARLVDEAEADLPEGATPDERKAARRKVRRQRLSNIALLNEAHGGDVIESLWAEMQRRRERYTRNLSNKLVGQGEPIDQRELDFQRGVWYGAMLALVALPREAAAALEAQRDDEDEEGAEPS